MNQYTFERYEIKYRIHKDQMARLKKVMSKYMRPNEYAFSTIRNIYYDTSDYRLIRTSLEKPFYKEKLRLRSYHTASLRDPVFVEIKKKYDSVVYKRRLSMPEQDAFSWLGYNDLKKPDTQIGNEISYFCEYYRTLRPSMYLSYDREAYQGIEDPDLRITFDTDILARTVRLRLIYDVGGIPLTDPQEVIMELKVSGAFPLWLSAFLAGEQIYPSSFSKYGTAYKILVQNTFPADVFSKHFAIA